ncbi:hypothetical protein K504DRAFT_173589 [Pleomassaria siparia CBS 279.74]|uniref:Pre-mRNA polyadenylation factor Fip1 domain-containing protein n=1 Tax=Pleomassaria siparia CBS 279.74 TaxID=1314801 RepID=A0A6G1JTV2_9PLEO|nr:hypothetical protein K504DRAFT_173589 [Pleomassaria siparia CBS 279.74]
MRARATTVMSPWTRASSRARTTRTTRTMRAIRCARPHNKHPIEANIAQDIDFIIEKPKVAPRNNVPSEPKESKAIKIEAPPQPSTTPAQGSKSTALSAPLQSGNEYPAVRTSTIDLTADPTYTPLGKPISQVDIDADLAESSKPWRLPGADQSDYFNYGFDEFNWEMYRQRQFNMTTQISAQKAEVDQLQAMLGGMVAGGAPSAPSGRVPGAPTGPAAQGGGMPGGMPPGGPNEEQMAMMFQMAAQTGDMSAMQDMQNYMTAMQNQGMAGGGGFGGQQQGGGAGYGQQGNQGGGGAGRGARRGRGNW